MSAKTRSSRPAPWVGAVFAAAFGLGLPAPAAAEEDLAEPPAEVAARDPFMRFNRASFAFSMGVDRWMTGPAVRAYVAVTPRVVRTRLSAAVDNLGEPSTALNDLAQGRGRHAGRATGRFLVNSTIGLAGLFDVAARAGLEPHEADFGQTLGRYGLRPGAYVFVPLLGPMTVRDGIGFFADGLADPVSRATGGVSSDFGRAHLTASLVTGREAADPAFRALGDAADPYATVRAAYLQHRAFAVAAARGETAELPDFAPATEPPDSGPAPNP